MLHDIGKRKINEDVLHKRRRLNEQEIEELRRHTQYGYEILRYIPAINEGVKLAVLQHHERFDGSEYPLHVRGEQIHQYARIVAIADLALGKKVRLNDNRTGSVVFIDNHHLTRPWVSIGDNIVCLSQEKNLYTDEILMN